LSRSLPARAIPSGSKFGSKVHFRFLGAQAPHLGGRGADAIASSRGPSGRADTGAVERSGLEMRFQGGTGAPRMMSAVTSPRPPWRMPSRTKLRRPTIALAWSRNGREV